MSEEIVLHEDKQFARINYAEKALRNREFHRCSFIGCDFTKSDLRNISFVDCKFEHCNLTMANIDGVSFSNAAFSGCKLLGLNFTRCNSYLFSFQFENCMMEYAIFFGTKLKKTIFRECNLRHVDFSEADLSMSNFSDSDLYDAQFHHTNLERADFRTATNFSINPETNRMKQARFSALGLGGLLHKYQLDIEPL